METGKNIIINALKGKKTSRPAWLPFVGVHGGFLINKTATEYLQSAENIVAGLKKANELYKPDGLPIVFDLQVEAEVLGCELKWADAVPPAVVSHPLTTQLLKDLPELNEQKGRFPIITRALDILKKDLGDSIALYGLICGPFTLALHLKGNDIFIDMYDKPDEISELLMYCADVCTKSADVYINHGVDVIAVVDPMTSQISAEHFFQFVTPAVNRVFDHVRNRSALSSMFVCGDATRNLEEMCKTTADNVSVDEQISLTDLRSLCQTYHKSFGGNIKLTAVLLLGNEDDAKLETLSIMDASGDTGFVLAPGCDLPYDVPVKNMQAVATMIHDEYARTVARTSLKARAADTFADINVPDYANTTMVIVDVITLDSTSCAPCQYMMEAVTKAVEASGIKVAVNEHKIKVREGIGMMVKLGVKNLPTICIDGEVAFASIIPDLGTLVKAIKEKAMTKKALNK